MSTTQQRLDSCRQAIADIESDGQEVWFEGRKWVGADIDKLYAREKDLMRQLAAEKAAAAGHVGGFRVAVPDFRC